ncbi:MAG: large conductance mechanosensitive channel protein MscL [Chloroflexales bacterium]|nr:large conductance mechanosensitive channel protein MscL [Chloroflexales bacterium]
MLKGFRDFLLRGNVVDLAVAVVVGAAFNDVVNGFIASFVDPLLAIALGAAGAENLVQATFIGFPVGIFLSAVVSFVIKAFVIYFFVVRPFASVFARLAPPDAVADDVRLLAEIRDELRRQSGAPTVKVSGD